MPGGSAAGLGAACETLVLNHPQLKRISRKCLRLPRVLGERDLTDLYSSSRRTAVVESEYDILEPEAAELALSTGPEPGGSIVVPVFSRSFSGLEVSLAVTAADAGEEGYASQPGNLADRDSVSETVGRTGSAAGYRNGPLFPAERLDLGAAQGSGRVTSPIFPMDGALAKVFSDGFLGSHPSDRSDWLRLLTSGLYQITLPGVPT